MPRKDPALRAEYARKQYLLHREERIASAGARKRRIQEQRKAAAIGPKEPEPRACLCCGADITLLYKSKWGPKCASCHSQAQRQYREANAAAISASKKAWAQANSQRKAEADRAYAQANPEARKRAREKWDAANPGASNAAKATNRISRKKRVPTWLSEDDRWIVAQAYELAAVRSRIFGFPWHVDHKIPLHGRRVSGLHVPGNLQVIPGMANLRKGIRFEGAN